MTRREIPKAAVEAAARHMQMVDAEEGFGDYPLSEYTEFASEILEAAAPHIAAQALSDAVDAFPLETITAPDNAVMWLRRRADELEREAK